MMFNDMFRHNIITRECKNASRARVHAAVIMRLLIYVVVTAEIGERVALCFAVRRLAELHERRTSKVCSRV